MCSCASAPPQPFVIVEVVFVAPPTADNSHTRVDLDHCTTPARTLNSLAQLELRGSHYASRPILEGYHESVECPGSPKIAANLVCRVGGRLIPQGVEAGHVGDSSM